MHYTNHRLLWKTVAPDRHFHAAMVAPSKVYPQIHTHDFHEMFFVEEGTGTHWINGETHALTAGDLVFIRPDDAHAFINQSRQNNYRINIAFRSDIWDGFRHLTNMPDWETLSMPPHVSLATGRRGEASQIFERALHDFHMGAGQLELCRFLSEAACLLRPDEETKLPLPAETPLWLQRACQLMEQDGNLQAGLPRFLDLCGVSEVHVARTLKLACGLTPTAWINRQRLTQAATLLATTPLSILDISMECGFENLSYFYRRFKQQYRQSPHAYRLGAQRRIVPDLRR